MIDSNVVTETRLDCFLDRAQYLAALHVDVIPVRPGAKDPVLKGWPQAATQDQAAIKRWAKQFPNHNTGAVANPDKLWLLDGDDPTIPERYERDTGEKFPLTFSVESRAGHRHYYFLPSEASRQLSNVSQDKVAGRAFSVRAKNEYVVGPGSIHPETGKPYRIVCDDNLAPVPDSLIAWIKTQIESPESGQDNRSSPQTPSRKIAAGARNCHLTSVAGKLHHAGISPDGLLDELVRQNRDCDPPLPDNEVRAIAKSVSRYERPHPVEDLSLVKVARLTLTPALEIEMKALNWLWPDRLPLGKATLFCGDPDIGKSLCVVDVVATVTTGRDWPDAKNEVPSSHVAMLCGEDEWDDTVMPRLFAAGADLTKVHRVNPIEVEFKGKTAQRAVALDRDIEAIKDMLHEHPEIRLLTFDPLASYLGDVNRNLEKEVRKILDAVKELAESTGVTILVADHFNKSLGASSIHRVAGSTSVVGAPRAVWGFVKDPENPDARIMVRIKCNITKKRSGLRYGFGERMLPVGDRLVATPYIVWTGKSDLTADEIFARNADPEDAKLTKAVRWLQSFLADGPRQAVEVYEEGAKQGYDSRYRRREVRDRAGIEKPYQVERRWMWRLATALLAPIDLHPDGSGGFAAKSEPAT